MGIESHDRPEDAIIIDIQDGRYGLAVTLDDGGLPALDRLNHLARLAREFGFWDDLLVFHDISRLGRPISQAMIVTRKVQ